MTIPLKLWLLGRSTELSAVRKTGMKSLNANFVAYLFTFFTTDYFFSVITEVTGRELTNRKPQFELLSLSLYSVMITHSTEKRFD